MWNFLRSGQNDVEAAAALDQLIHELSSVQDALPSDQVVAANSYLIWAEKAERQLIAIYEDFTISRQLHSDRYWQIRALASATSRPIPLIRAEIELQTRHLEGLLHVVVHSLLATGHIVAWGGGA